MLRVTRRADRVFGSFIKGKLIEAVIVWGVMFLGMSVFNMPFAMLISVIVAVTNIIPFFGPFIGVIPSAVLILVVNPMTALYFVIFALFIGLLTSVVVTVEGIAESVILATTRST